MWMNKAMKYQSLIPVENMVENRVATDRPDRIPDGIFDDIWLGYLDGTSSQMNWCNWMYIPLLEHWRSTGREVSRKSWVQSSSSEVGEKAIAILDCSGNSRARGSRKTEVFWFFSLIYLFVLWIFVFIFVAFWRMRTYMVYCDILRLNQIWCGFWFFSWRFFGLSCIHACLLPT